MHAHTHTHACTHSHTHTHTESFSTICILYTIKAIQVWHTPCEWSIHPILGFLQHVDRQLTQQDGWCLQVNALMLHPHHKAPLHTAKMHLQAGNTVTKEHKSVQGEFQSNGTSPQLGIKELLVRNPSFQSYVRFVLFIFRWWEKQELTPEGYMPYGPHVCPDWAQLPL